jgi:hypothetical protein
MNNNNIASKIYEISDIWTHFIFEYKFCNSKIKFTEDVRSNYVADLVNYFIDTESVINLSFSQNQTNNNFADSISFLQAIYIQQDLVEELLLVFKCNINKGNLKLDKSYSVNREIRNELVGHPIRKNLAIGADVISSTLFHFRYSDNSKIVYLRYHKKNDYNQELIAYDKREILERHFVFLNKYIDLILDKLRSVLGKFLQTIVEVELWAKKMEFRKFITVISHNYEYIFTRDRLFKQENLLAIYNKINDHKRYKNMISFFYSTLKSQISSDKRRIKDFQKGLSNPAKHINARKKDKNKSNAGHKNEQNIHYEISKLSNRKKFEDFLFFSRLLKRQYPNKRGMIKELENMKTHFNDDIEYYCSYLYIKRILKY